MDTSQTPAPLPFETSATSSSEYLLKALLLTAVLLGACYLLLWLGKRYGLIRTRPRGTAAEIEILESMRLNAYTNLYALRFRGKTLLLAESSRRVALREAGEAGEGSREVQAP